MSKKDKRIKRLLQKPRDYTFDEAKALLNSFGYKENNKGKTSGSRIIFDKGDGYPIMLHCPHNPPYLRVYMINEIIKRLKESGDIDE